MLSDGALSTGTREDVQTARTLRGSLSAHDCQLLDAMEPLTFVPSDLGETQRRFEDAAKKDPGNADLLFWLGFQLHGTTHGGRAMEAFDGALARDPAFAMAWCMKGREKVLVDDIRGAIDAYGKCLEISPTGTSCLEDLSRLQAGEGKCEEMVATVRRLVSAAPDVASSYGTLGQALFGSGESMDAVRAAFQQKWDRTSPAQRDTVKLRDEATLAVLLGRFDEGDRLIRALADATSSAPDDLTHFRGIFWRVAIYQELGKDAEVRSLASDYLRQRPAWAVNDFGAAPTIHAYAALKKALFVEGGGSVIAPS
jgi:tetratricopeptide (TPR) repeat protein